METSRYKPICLLSFTTALSILSVVAGHGQFDNPPRSFTYGSVEKAAYTPDERLFVTSGSDGLHIFDGTTMEDVAHLERAKGPLHRDDVALCFSNDSRLLAFPFGDTTAVVWDLETFAEVAVIKGHAERVSAIVFSHDGSLMATGDPAGRMMVWSTDTWERLAERTNEYVRALAFHGTDTLISSNGFRSIRLWTLPEFERGPDFAHEDNVRRLIVLPDERRLLSAADDGTVRLWDLLTGEALAVMRHPGSYTSGLILATDARHVVFRGSASTYGGTHLWTLDPPAEVGVFSGSGTGVVGFTNDGRRLLVWSSRSDGEDDGYALIRSWDLASRQFVDSLRVDDRGQGAFAQEAMQLTMVLTGSGSIDQFDLNTRSMRSRTAVYLQGINDVAFSPGGEWVAAAYSRTIHIWDAASRELLKTLRTESSIDKLTFTGDCRDLIVKTNSGLYRRPLQDTERSLPLYSMGGLSAVAFTPDARSAALGWHFGRAAVLDLDSLQEQVFEEHPDDLQTIALSTDGELLAVSGEWRDSPSIWLWNVPDAMLLDRLPTRRGGAFSLAFRADGGLLAAGGWYDGIELWSMDPITLIDSVTTRSTVRVLDFSPDRRWLAFGDGGLQPLGLVDLNSGDRVATHPYRSWFGPDALAFSPGGGRISMGDSGGRVLLWDTDQVEGPSASPCGDVNLGSHGTETVIADAVERAGSLEVAVDAGRPNPIGGHTVVPFFLPRDGTVRLEVYNLAGQLVRVLAQDHYRAGAHEITWDARDSSGRRLASGVYLVRMLTGDAVRHRKLTIVR